MASTDVIADRWQTFFSDRVTKRVDLTQAYVRYVARQIEAGLPPIFESSHLSSLMGLEPAVVASLINGTANHYREFAIPKRRGGSRTIKAPDPTLLQAQRWIVRNILSKVSVHPCSHGYTEGKSIISNVKPHVGCEWLLKMDLMDFFPSIGLRRGIAIFRRLGYPPNVSFYLAAICFLEARLPQGSAASPAISNVVAKRLDVKIADFANLRSLTYTRYADDLTLSGGSITGDVIRSVSELAASEGFIVNSEKTLLLGPSRKKVITGVSISSGIMKLPRKAVRAVRLEAHHILKRGVREHMQKTGRNDPLIVERLLGRVMFWLQVEPDNQTARRYRDEIVALQSELDQGLAW